MPTFAFSHTGDYWKTRYSFEPTNYTYIDSKLISYRATTATENEDNEDNSMQRIAWVHNAQGTPRNNFYGTQYNSKVLVSSNQDPSAEKVFNSVSLETNQNNFIAAVFTNVDINSSSTTKIQASTIDKFVHREENLYADIRPSVTNSTSNMRPIGLVKSYDPSANTITLYGTVSNVMVGARPVFARTIGEETILTTNITSVSGADAVISSNNPDISSIEQFLNIALASPASILGGTSVISAATHNGYETVVTIGGSGLLAGDYIIPDNTRLLALLDPSVHGDAIRGKYMLVDLTTIDGSKPFELYAVNVDYSFSNLDSRLGQNS